MSTFHAVSSTTSLNDHGIMLHDMHAEKLGDHIVTEIPLNSTSFDHDPIILKQSYRRSTTLANHKPVKKVFPLDQFLKACRCQAPLVKAAVITVITGIPFLVFLLVARFAFPKGRIIGPPGSEATLFELAKWLVISWITFMGLLWCGRVLAALSAWCCSLLESWNIYQRLAEAVCTRIVLMFWAVVCHSVLPRVFHRSLGNQATATDWTGKLQKAFLFLIIAFAIILVQGIFLELSAINYIQGWMGPRSQRASDELDTIRQLYELTNPHIASNGAGYFHKLAKKLLLPFDDTDIYYRMSLGQGDPELWSQYANHVWNSISQGKSSINRFDIDQQLRVMNRDPARGFNLFLQLDDSCDGEVTLDEVEKLVRRVGLQLNTRARAQHGINTLLRKLEILLSIVMAGIILFLYIQFFEKQYSKDLGTFWTGLTGLSFAFGGVLLEFSNACVFVFGKHPYDVGDYVESKGKKLIVNKIFLTHTNFEEVADPEERGVVVQISHASLMAEPIVNWTRTLEAVVEMKKTRSEADKAKEATAAEKEANEKEDARNLILLKTAHLRSLQENE